jgi:hypothetical protein
MTCSTHRNNEKYSILKHTPEWKRASLVLKHGWDDNIKWILEEWVAEMLKAFVQLRIRIMSLAFVNEIKKVCIRVTIDTFFERVTHFPHPRRYTFVFRRQNLEAHQNNVKQESQNFICLCICISNGRIYSACTVVSVTSYRWFVVTLCERC